MEPITRLGGLALRLVRDGLLSEEQATAATEAATLAQRPWVTYIVSQGLVKAHDVAVAASVEYGVPLFDLDAMDPENMPTGLTRSWSASTMHCR